MKLEIMKPFLWSPEVFLPASKIKEIFNNNQIYEVFYKIGVPKNFGTFPGKYLHWILYLNKVTGFEPATLLQKDSGTVAFQSIL